MKFVKVVFVVAYDIARSSSDAANEHNVMLNGAEKREQVSPRELEAEEC